MDINQQWSILWPKSISNELLEKCILMQLQQNSSQILISNRQPKKFYSRFIAEKSDFCQNTYLEVNLEKSLLDKNYRLEMQDKLCFLAEEYTGNHSHIIHWEFNTTIIPKIKNDFSRHLMDILVFFQERFISKIKSISVFINAPNFELKNTLDFLRTSDSHPFFGLSYYPYYCEKQSYDTLKTSFLWKPWTHTVLLTDVGFDLKTEVVPGEGITFNKSACQIALENKKMITFIFKPLTLTFVKESKIEEFLWKSEDFIRKLLL